MKEPEKGIKVQEFDGSLFELSMGKKMPRSKQAIIEVPPGCKAQHLIELEKECAIEAVQVVTDEYHTAPALLSSSLTWNPETPEEKSAFVSCFVSSRSFASNIAACPTPAEIGDCHVVGFCVRNFRPDAPLRVILTATYYDRRET